MLRCKEHKHNHFTELDRYIAARHTFVVTSCATRWLSPIGVIEEPAKKMKTPNTRVENSGSGLCPMRERTHSVDGGCEMMVA